MPAFIETQFPIARLSAESYKERKANNGQTLTRLGKWWGRKPLILVRASIIGMLMPASDNPKRDREIFLKILTMDDDGVWQRVKEGGTRPPWLSDDIQISRAEFDALNYAERLRDCERPENVNGPDEDAWTEINTHLDTTATNLPELVEQLGQKQFGHRPRVGDSFCGGGSIPFEAARIGCDAFGSDLNPVAGLLTWASLNLLGGGREVQEEVMRVQAEALAAADRQVTDWNIEHNDRGERADAYLYCVEVKPEGCDYFIPLAPSWLVGEKSKVVARWQRVPDSDRLTPEIAVVSADEMKRYKEKKGATVIDSRVVDPFNPARSWSVEALRGPEGLRRWTNEDLVPRPGDVFQERLYCIRWAKTVIEILPNGKQKKTIVRRYAAPDATDLAREAKVLELLRERFDAWQREGFIPSRAIPEGGDETARLYRERGWTYWHHLFTPRQLLTHGLLAELSFKGLGSDFEHRSDAEASPPHPRPFSPQGEKGEKPLSPAVERGWGEG
ncbi:DUF1156 domain-containing protein [uncultured Thiocystis sp.]|jgi:adenine-specific DNA methylase|uniref:DUF1156 domain-containing protein n=1 Tax=uncultured Thiocystis sp. TaxID=1202134 RepID=UPI0025F4BECF|nr:DUF1156 domain-containing protein [uncultured Thiocystis sp.]